MDALLHLLCKFGDALLGPGQFLGGLIEAFDGVVVEGLLLHLLAQAVHLVLGLAGLLDRFFDRFARFVMLGAEFLASQRFGVLVDADQKPFRISDAGPPEICGTSVLGSHPQLHFGRSGKTRPQLPHRDRRRALKTRRTRAVDSERQDLIEHR